MDMDSESVLLSKEAQVASLGWHWSETPNEAGEGQTKG